ncbi:hypothetical protein GUJ93_ZPchr0012g19599 [Zizania palustris]|uniref:DUF4005 domain-containing protein n=1 Tax=Zizania palustris TaxID=103762 RepID=A0A8J5WQA2_ZIZPA|nr:hypothetical protein GUJ93_ZPchr0012g19599 [Zizania palustris]
MGKAGRWIRSFLITKRDRKGKDKADGQLFPSTGHVSSAVPTPSAKEKRRWSFRRSAATSKETSASLHCQLASTSSHCFSEVHVVVYEQLAAAATSDVAIATAEVAPPAPERSVSGSEEAAAIKIQSAFRSYLARKALCALRGMVKLQAMVRGQLVRRQANMTLRRMQALVAAQKRARAERLRLLEEDKHTRSPRPPTSCRSSPQHHRSRKPLEVVDRGSEENVKIVEVDNGGGDARGTPRTGGWRSTCASASLSRTPAKAELYQKVSPTPSALTDASARTISGRFEDYPFSAASEAGGCNRAAAACTGKVCHASDHATLQLFPNYMANTESSRAKARSQSAPRQRHEMSASPSPSPSCGAGGGRRRASLDPRDLAGARMERCASQARASASGACPWAVVSLDKSSASLPGSECGSSSTVVTAATAARVTSRHAAPVAAATV